MSGLPPTYEEASKASEPRTLHTKLDAWRGKFVSLNFTDEEAKQYAQLFLDNEIEIGMIAELNDGNLKNIGIEKAGHRIRILRLQQKASPATKPVSPPAATATATPALNTPRCAWHPNVVANEKCRRCNRLLCLNCRREKFGDSGTRYFCRNCYEECVIL